MGVLRQYQSQIHGNYRKSALKYGLWAGVVLSLLILFCRIIIFPVSSPDNYLTNIGLFVSMLSFTILYRRTLPENKVTFKELMLLGMGMGVVAAVVYGLFLLLYGSVFDGEFLGRYIDFQSQRIQESEMNAEEMNLVMQNVKNYKLYDVAIIGTIRTAVVSIIESFIVSLILRNEKGTVINKQK